jgi:hypothetical protein
MTKTCNKRQVSAFRAEVCGGEKVTTAESAPQPENYLGIANAAG